MPLCRCKFVEFFVLHHIEKNGLITEDIIIENKKNTPLKYIEVSLQIFIVNLLRKFACTLLRVIDSYGFLNF